MGTTAIAARLLILLATIVPGLITAQVLTEQEQRGKKIFVGGESEFGTPISAIVSRGATPIPASILPCVGCHGEDGTGRPEGGVVPSNLTWNTLTAPNGHQHAYGRAHPQFDESSLKIAISQGQDPAGNALDIAMPRYQMTSKDMTDLVAYLKRIDTDLDDGLTESSIRVGALLPMEGPLGSVGTVMKRVMEASFAEINASGGIHGRRIELVIADYGDDLQKNVWEARDLLQQHTVFAMVGSYTAGIEQAMAVAAEELEVPIIGSFTQLPRTVDGLQRHSFYLTGGLVHQAALLARRALSPEADGFGRLAIVHPPDQVGSEAVEAVSAQLEERAAPSPLTIPYVPGYLDAVDIARTLMAETVTAVVFLGSARDLKRLASGAQKEGYEPQLMLPGMFAGREMFEIAPEFGGRVLVGYSSTPADHTLDGVREFEALHTKHGFGFAHSPAQISAFVAVKVFVEGLKRAGRALSRERLISALEGLTDFNSGLMPPISYNRGRRIGSLGGYVLELDLVSDKFVPSNQWISLSY